MPSPLTQSARRLSSNLILIILLVVSLVVVTVYAREGEFGVFHNLQYTMSSAFGPVKAISGGVSSVTQGTSDTLANATADSNTLSGLKEQNEQLRQEVAKLEEYRQQSQRLQSLLDLKDSYTLEGPTGTVLSRSSDAWNQVVTVDVGTDRGVRTGLPVIGNTGLVGQVVTATASTSDIRLLSDPQSGVAVIIQSNRTEGILRGSLEGLLYLEDVDQGAEVNVGDVVLTSGVGGGYYEGIMVGTVVKIDQKNGDIRQIVVAPNESAQPLHEVLIATSASASSAVDSSDGSSTSGTSSSTSNSSTSNSSSSSADSSDSSTSNSSNASSSNSSSSNSTSTRSSSSTTDDEEEE